MSRASRRSRPASADPTPGSPDLPPAFVERLRRIVPAERLEAVRASFAAPRPVTVRVNTLRARPEEVTAELAAAGLAPEPVAWCPEALVLRGGDLRVLQATDAHRRGALYVQGLASLTAILALDPRPGEQVLDLAAAPGGKTTHIAARMEGQGRLLANDRSRTRVYRLKAVLEQQGADFVECTCRPGEALARRLAGTCDRVLLDAPCSAEARLRAGDAESLRGWKMARVKRLAGQQRRLLVAAAAALRPGGVLVYATCTFAPEEDEGVVDHALTVAEGALALEPIALDLPNRLPGLTAWGRKSFHPSLEHAVRLLPDALMEGFFLARLRRLAEA